MTCLLQRPITDTPPENARGWQAAKEVAGIWVSESHCWEDEFEYLWTDLGGEG
jgi:hypothetical protein